MGSSGVKAECTLSVYSDYGFAGLESVIPGPDVVQDRLTKLNKKYKSYDIVLILGMFHSDG